jgi:predicted Ser/Thr protein kinase/intein/homing endonuclease
MQRQDMSTSAFHSDGAEGRRILAELASLHDVQRYREYHWEGSFADYLEIVTKNPKVARSAFQRIYDMIMHFGYTEYTEHKEKLIHYHFFDDPVGNGEDAIYGLDRYLMVLVNIFKSAARRYGTERRIILLHGPVGSSKSTIVRLLKKGLEYYTRLPEGAVYSFGWILEDGSFVPCPLNEEPLKLIPPEVRVKFLERLNEGKSEEEQIWVEGDLCPLCRFYFREFMRKYQGDWQQVVENHIRVRRVIFSEKDRIGIGTFQPKDEKCLHGSTLCATEHGLLPLQDLFLNLNGNRPKEGEFAPLQIVVQSVTKRTEASHLYFDGIKPMLEVQTKFGYSLVGTSNHRVMVLEDGELKWKRLGELRKGDYVALYRGANSFGSNRTLPSVDGYNLPQSATILDEDMAYWLGLLVADGSVTVFDVRFTNTSEQLLHFFVEFGQRRFGVQSKIYRKKGHKVANAVLESKDLARWLASDVGVRRSAESKQVPPAILQAPREIVLAFLAGLFDGDGCFRLKSNGVNEFTFSSASKTLAKQVHLLLLNLGVVASLYEQVIDGKPYYSIVARGDSVCELNETLPLRLKKRTDLAPVKGREAKWDILPNVEPLLAEFPELSYYFRRVLETGRRLTRAKAKELLAHLPSDNPKVKFLRWLVEAPIIWLPVIKISLVSEAPAFDLSIPVWQAYVADGFVVHNSQDATELTGDINYRKIAIYGSESDPRAFDFDGEFCIANRGLLEFIELLKLETEFLYDLLGATQEHVIKPRKFAQVDIDEVVLGHTNEPEYRKLQKNEYMEALRDRTIKVDIPYVLKLSDEVKIYEKFFNPKRVKGKHIAPHTLEIAAMWAILTRLEEPKKFNLTLMQKLKLYDGKALPGFTEDHVIELREEAPREGMFGISPRYVMDKISNALVSEENPHCVNPFMVMKELDEGLDHYSLVSSEEQRKRYRELLALVRQEYEEIIKNEVRRAITADEEALKRLCQNYIENVKAYVRGEKVRNRYTGELEEPDERLMRSIEEKIDIPESRKDDFRREIMNYIASLALEGKQFDYKSNERLLRALELKLFEDQKDSIRLSAIATGVVDKETQEKIDVIKARLIREYGYCEVCATDILTYVASIFARGDIKEREEARR